MIDTFTMEFIGGSVDGAVVEATDAPDRVAIDLGGNLREIYERQNDEPPFVYVQVGYSRSGTWN
jgi:hypothetical protein